jgi:hypothetical protein
MRAFGLIILCLSLALQGPVQARMLKKPCPMEQGSQAAAATDATPAQDDCCNDDDTAAKTGKTCKAGHECQSSSACLLVSPSYSSDSPRASQPLRVVERLAPADSPASVWRPPALT